MFSLFKKRQPPLENTFKTKVEKFWEWFALEAGRFYQTIEEGKCPALAAEVGAKVDSLLPGLAWVFGPGPEGVGHSFTFSGEGALHRQLLAIQCVERAPKLSGWTFYGSRQPGAIEGMHMQIAGRRFDPLEFWLTPQVNSETENVDITVWHPLFKELTEAKDRYHPLFLFLDQVLGEFGTGQWIGEINFGDSRLAEAIPLKELHAFIQALAAEKGWRKLPPGEAASLYTRKAPGNRFLRDDVVVGSTMHMRLINEYYQAEGALQNPIANTGADYAFISFLSSILPKGKATETRGEIEDALTQCLRSAQSGRLLGGAFGTKHSYIDLLLLDGSNSINLVKETLRRHQLPAGTAINYFAKELKSKRVVL